MVVAFLTVFAQWIYRGLLRERLVWKVRRMRFLLLSSSIFPLLLRFYYISLQRRCGTQGNLSLCKGGVGLRGASKGVPCGLRSSLVKDSYI